jgi:hypothetical protein
VLEVTVRNPLVEPLLHGPNFRIEVLEKGTPFLGDCVEDYAPVLGAFGAPDQISVHELID